MSQHEGTVIAETEAALLVEIDGEEIWLPKSHCQFDPEEPGVGEDVTVTMPRWLAKAKGLE